MPGRKWVIILAWTIAAGVIALLVTTFVVRSYRVNGISMQPTLHTGDVVMVNKLGRSLSSLLGHTYTPKRGELVVFKNPLYGQGDSDAFIIKRVIGLPGDRVVVRDGRITVYAQGNQDQGFNPDDFTTGPQGPTSGNVDRTVPESEIFVAGDNRQGKNSLDSRNGLSTVPMDEVQGTAMLRFWPLNGIRQF